MKVNDFTMIHILFYVSNQLIFGLNQLDEFRFLAEIYIIIALFFIGKLSHHHL